MISKQSDSSISSIDGTLSGTTTPGQSGPGNNGKKGVLLIPKSFRTGASISDGSVSYTGHSFRWGLNPL